MLNPFPYTNGRKDTPTLLFSLRILDVLLRVEGPLEFLVTLVFVDQL